MQGAGAIQLGNTVAINTLERLEAVMRYQEENQLTHAQRNGLDLYALSLIESLRGVLGRNVDRVGRLEELERLAFKRPKPEELPF